MKIELNDYLDSIYQQSTGKYYDLIEKLRILKLNDELSTEYVEVHVEDGSITLHLPEELYNAIEMEKKRLKYIFEAREKANKGDFRYIGRFPIGNTKVKNIFKLIDDLYTIQNKYVGEVMSRQMIQNIHHMEIQRICDLFIKNPNGYVEYI